MKKIKRPMNQWGSTQRNSYPKDKSVPKEAMVGLTPGARKVYKQMHKKKRRQQERSNNAKDD